MAEEQTLDVAALKAAHQPAQDRIYETCSILYHGACAACRDQYPCLTAQLIDAYERQQADLAACRAENERLFSALAELFHLKAYKDKHGKDDYYRSRQPSAWEAARAALQSREEVG